MSKRIMGVFFAIAAGMIVLASAANATPLENAVASYNSAASGLQSLWTRYNSEHNAAFDDYAAMMNNFYSYITAESGSQDDVSYYAAYQAAQSSLLNTSGPAVDSSFEAFVSALDDAAQLLDTVLALDEASAAEVAYATGGTLFSLPEQPFPFWDDPSWPDISEWREFTFPELAVGTPETCVAYSGDGLDDLEVFLQSATDPEAWIKLGEWLYEHYDDADEINAVRAGDFDALCAFCLTEFTCYLNWLVNRDYTEEEIENWCEFYADDWCGQTGLSAKTKATAVRECVRRKLVEDLQKVMDAIEDYVNSAYWMEFPRTIPAELL